MDILDFPYSNVYRLNFILLRISGLWPYEKKFINITIRIFVFTIVCPTLITQGLKMAETWFDVDIFINIMPYLSASIIGTSTLVILYGNTAKLGEIWHSIKWNMNQNYNEEELNIIKIISLEGFKMNNFLLSGGVGGLILFLPMSMSSYILDVILPLNQSRPKELPFEADYLIDTEKYFFCIMIHVGLVLSTSGIIVYANILLYVNSVYHACAILSAIGYRLEHAFDESETRSEYTLYFDDIKVYQDLIFCIERHQEIIKFVSLTESYFAPVIFVQLIGVIVILSVVLVQVFMLQNIEYKNISTIIAAFVYLNAATYVGQKLIDSSSGISDKLYSGKWYNSSIKIQKLLLLMIRRSHLPCTITAYKLFVVSLETCRSVVSTSLSYCTIIRQIL